MYVLSLTNTALCFDDTTNVKRYRSVMENQRGCTISYQVKLEPVLCCGKTLRVRDQACKEGLSTSVYSLFSNGPRMTKVSCFVVGEVGEVLHY